MSSRYTSMLVGGPGARGDGIPLLPIQHASSPSSMSFGFVGFFSKRRSRKVLFVFLVLWVTMALSWTLSVSSRITTDLSTRSSSSSRTHRDTSSGMGSIPRDSNAFAVLAVNKNKQSSEHNIPKKQTREAQQLLPSNDGATAPTRARKLVLASHNRLFYLDVDTFEETTIHEGDGVYYGVFPGPKHETYGDTLWVVSRPHNHHPKESIERLLNVAANPPQPPGITLREVVIPSRFAHDAVLDTNHGVAYVASTEDGTVLELDANTMQLRQKHELFTRHDHVNTISPIAAAESGDSKQFWAMLHRMGKPSTLVQLDVDTKKVRASWSGFGKSSHGIVQASDARSLYVLDSGEGSLLRLSPPVQQQQQQMQETDEDGSVKPDISVLWRDPQQTFLKGVCVIDGVAYVGVSEFGTRAERARLDKTADIVAVRLSDGKQLFRRTVESRGLLNVVAAPHIDAASTYRELVNWGTAGNASPNVSPKTYLDISAKNELSRLDHSTTSDMQLDNPMLYVPAGTVPESLLAPLDNLLNEHPEYWDEFGPGQKDNARFVGRAGNIQHFKPGVATINLMFSDRAANRFFAFPFEKRFHDAVYPIMQYLLSPILGANAPLLNHACRVQLSFMSGDAKILEHVDRGAWVSKCHRLHVPLHTHDGVHFDILVSNPAIIQHLGEDADVEKAKGGKFHIVRVPTRRGEAFEINNMIKHRVRVDEPTSTTRDRVHLIIDWHETAHPYDVLFDGAECEYKGDVTECDAKLLKEHVPSTLS